MKKNLTLFLCASLLFSCGSSTTDPVASTKKFMEAVEKFDFKNAREMITANYLPSLERIEKAAERMSTEEKAKKIERTSKFKMDYTLSSKTDSTATVSVAVQASENSIHVDFFLKKQSGKWLIDNHKDEY